MKCMMIFLAIIPRNFSRLCNNISYRAPFELYGHKLLSKMGLSASLFNGVEDFDLKRSLEDGALELHVNDPAIRKPFRINFMNSKRSLQAPSELVAKAFGKCNIIVDLTAGLGRDSFILASSGRRVLMNERNPYLHALLEDSLLRLRCHDPALAEKLSLSNIDIAFGGGSIHIPAELQQQGEISVYLDPMYPQGIIGKRSQVKKETQILHRLARENEGNDDQNNRFLFDTAMQLATDRIVVKRPLAAEPLLAMVPHSTIKGSTQRFDIYFMRRKIEITKAT